MAIMRVPVACLADIQRELPAFTPPFAVKLLGRDLAQRQRRRWRRRRRPSSFTAARAPAPAPGSIFESNELLLAYAHDELARIERLVDANEDNRSALVARGRPG